MPNTINTNKFNIGDKVSYIDCGIQFNDGTVVGYTTNVVGRKLVEVYSESCKSTLVFYEHEVNIRQ